jgi:hypothetical protein
MTLLQILKLLGITVTSISGILATAYETKTEGPDKRKRLNHIGLVLLVLIFVGSLMAAAAQIVEDNNRAHEAKQAAMQRSEDVARLTTQGSELTETHRLLADAKSQLEKQSNELTETHRLLADANDALSKEATARQKQRDLENDTYREPQAAVKFLITGECDEICLHNSGGVKPGYPHNLAYQSIRCAMQHGNTPYQAIKKFAEDPFEPTQQKILPWEWNRVQAYGAEKTDRYASELAASERDIAKFLLCDRP